MLDFKLCWCRALIAFWRGVGDVLVVSYFRMFYVGDKDNERFNASNNTQVATEFSPVTFLRKGKQLGRVRV